MRGAGRGLAVNDYRYSYRLDYRRLSTVANISIGLTGVAAVGAAAPIIASVLALSAGVGGVGSAAAILPQAAIGIGAAAASGAVSSFIPGAGVALPGVAAAGAAAALTPATAAGPGPAAAAGAGAALVPQGALGLTGGAASGAAAALIASLGVTPGAVHATGAANALAWSIGATLSGASGTGSGGAIVQPQPTAGGVAAAGAASGPGVAMNIGPQVAAFGGAGGMVGAFAFFGVGAAGLGAPVGFSIAAGALPGGASQGWFWMSAGPLADLSYDIPVLGPIGVGIASVVPVWQQVLAADLTRRGVVFHNPGNVDVLVAPANLASQPATDAGALRIYPGNDLVLLTDDEHTNVNAAWQAWVDAGTGKLSILNFSGTNPAQATQMPLISLSQGSSITSPISSGVLLGTVSTTVIATNPQRRGISFSNPGTVTVAVSPANLTASIGAGSIIVLPGQTRTYMANSRSRIRVNCGWNGISASGSNNPLTSLEHLG